jgi:GNAT superfamily N-acetyltransferase
MVTFKQFIAEEKKNNKYKIKSVGNDYIAYHGSNRVGHTTVWKDLNHGKLSAYKSYTKPKYRKRGVMTALYNHIEKERGEKMHPSSTTTDDAYAFWHKRDPDSVKDDMRKHKEKLMGKRVTGKNGTATITKVGPGGAVATYHHDNRTTYLNKTDLQKHKLVD